jgi:hypothetical protein
MALAASMNTVAAQWINYPTPNLPRNPDGTPNLSAPVPKLVDGKPDLSGFWRINGSRGYDLNTSSDLEADEIAPSARELFRQRFDDYGRGGRADTNCLPHGPAVLLHWNGPAKFIHTPGLLAVLYADLTYRQIFLDGRALPEVTYPSWMGYSVGHWEGDTLVVESTGYAEKSWLDLGGHPHTEKLRTTERFQRNNWGRMNMEVQYSDPGIYARPWSVPMELSLASDQEMIEGYCGENEKDLDHFVGKRSDGAVRVPPEVLVRYTGVFSESLPNGVSRRIVFSLYDGALWVGAEGAARLPLVPRSQTTFDAYESAPYEFVVNSDGAVTEYRADGRRGLRANPSGGR